MRKIIRALSAAVMIICAVVLVQYILSYRDISNDLQQAQQSELMQLQQQNTRIIGWLSLAGTRLDNPVLQATDNDFYLMHNYLDEKVAGAVFSQIFATTCYRIVIRFFMAMYCEMGRCLAI